MDVFIFLLMLSLIMVFSYMLSVLAIQYFKKVDTRTARTIIASFVKDCFTTKEPEWFGISIGIDPNGVANASEIDNAFSDLRQIYKNFYFYDCGIQNNQLIYRFHVSTPVVQLSDEDLYEYCRATCDAIVHNYVHKYNPAFTHIDNLVEVDMDNAILIVSIAENSAAINEHVRHADHMHRYFKQMSMPNQTEDISESWN